MRPAVLATVLCVATIAAYATSFKGVFVYDDGVAIVQNPNIKSLWPLTSAMSAPPESPMSARPVAALSLAMNYALAPAAVRDVMEPERGGEGGDGNSRYLRNLWGYHAGNLLLHLLTALAIAGVVRQTLLSERLRNRFGSVATPLAFTAALIWAVHPLTTDAVTYIAQRTEVLMALFFAVTLYLCAKSGSGVTSDSKSFPTAVLAIVACAAGMGSKQTMVTAPLAVLAWDWIFLGGLRRWRLYAGLCSTWLLLAALVAYERWPTSIGFDLEGWTPWTYLLTQTTVIAHYLRLSVFGGPLALDYDGWPMVTSVAAALPYALPLAALLGLTIWGLVRRRPWSFPALVWFLALAPSSSVLPLATEIAAGRRMYLPLAAFICLGVVAGFEMGRRLVARAAGERTRRTAGRALAAVVVVAVAGTYGALTYARNQDFWSTERIWQDTVEKQPANSRARQNYGASLLQSGRTADAEGQLREAVRLKDTNAAAHLNLGSLLASRGRTEEGIAHLERALAFDPSYAIAHRNLGEAYGSLGDHVNAAKHFMLASEARPDDVFLLNRLAWLLATSPEDRVRNGARATAAAERAVGLTGRKDPVSLDVLAAAYAETGRYDEAMTVARDAVEAAVRSDRNDLISPIQMRLLRYRAGTAYRER